MWFKILKNYYIKWWKKSHVRKLREKTNGKM